MCLESKAHVVQAEFQAVQQGRARWDCTCCRSQATCTAACQKELATPAQTQFRTGIPRGGGGVEHLVATVVKAKKKKERGHSNELLNVFILGWVQETFKVLERVGVGRGASQERNR